MQKNDFQYNDIQGNDIQHNIWRILGTLRCVYISDVLSAKSSMTVAVLVLTHGQNKTKPGPSFKLLERAWLCMPIHSTHNKKTA